MNNFTSKIFITGSIYLPMYDDHPDVATFEDYGYTRSFIFEGGLHKAMLFAKKKCATTLTIGDKILSPYLIKIKSVVHKNTIVGADARYGKIKWIIPKRNEDLSAVNENIEKLHYEASEELRGDNFDTIRQLRFEATLEKLKCADYWKYRPNKQH